MRHHVAGGLSISDHRVRPGFYNVTMNDEYMPHRSDSVLLGTVSRASGYEWVAQANEDGTSCRFAKKDQAVRWFFKLAEQWALRFAIEREAKRREGEGAPRKDFR